MYLKNGWIIPSSHRNMTEFLWKNLYLLQPYLCLWQFQKKKKKQTAVCLWWVTTTHLGENPSISLQTCSGTLRPECIPKFLKCRLVCPWQVWCVHQVTSIYQRICHTLAHAEYCEIVPMSQRHIEVKFVLFYLFSFCCSCNLNSCLIQQTRWLWKVLYTELKNMLMGSKVLNV